MEITIQRIKNLNIKYFRGIVEQDISFNGESIVVYGENGCGKSSFVDALEFFFNGNLSYLDETKTTSTVRNVPHISYKKEDCRVGIEFLQGQVNVERSFQDISKMPPDIENYFNLGIKTHFILRRKYLLDFIVAQPAPRYTQLAVLMGINDLDKVELALKNEDDEILEKVTSLENKINRENIELNNTLGEEVTSESHIIELINKKLKEFELSINSLKDISRIKTNLVEKISGIDLKKAIKLKEIKNEIESLTTEINFLSKHNNFWESIGTLKKDKQTIEEIIFQQVLEQGKKYIIEKKLDQCPLCLQPFELIKRNDVIASIERRLKDYSIIAEHIEKIKQYRSSLIIDLSEYSDRVEILKKKLLDVGCDRDLTFLNNIKIFLTKLKSDVSIDIVKINLDSLDKYMTKANGYKPLMQELNNWSKNELQKNPVDKKSEHIVKIIDYLTKTNEICDRIEKFTNELNNKKQLKEQINMIYEAFIRTKNEEVQKIYNEIEKDFCKYYECLHPNEETGSIKLEVKRRASAEIKTKFYSRLDEDPRGFYSEAHLDSLGLCIFLAFVKKFNTEFPLIVLDDVVASIDASHRNRIAELIFNEFPDKQFLITTHDNIWFEELCASEQAFSVGNKYQNIKILRWSLEEGPILDKFKPPWDDIEDKLEKGQKTEAGNTGRIYLEWVLDEMTINMMAQVLRKRGGRYDVGDLYEPLKNRIKRILPEYFKREEQIFKKLEMNKIFGNLLSHYNPDFKNISISEIKDFTDSVKSLHDLFYCQKCRAFVRYFQDAKIVKCNNGCITWGVK